MTSISNHTFTYLKGMAQGLHWTNTLHALYIARDAHKDQKRNSGEPYIVHPLTVAGHAVALGMMEDELVATAILHDWVEDCGGDVTALPCNDTVKRAITLVTHVKDPDITREQDLERYYGAIATDRIATLVKLLDRANNVSTMAGVFKVERLERYIHETRNYVLPLLRHAKESWPEYSDALFALKYHITAVVDSIEATMTAYK